MKVDQLVKQVGESWYQWRAFFLLSLSDSVSLSLSRLKLGTYTSESVISLRLLHRLPFLTARSNTPSTIALDGFMGHLQETIVVQHPLRQIWLRARSNNEYTRRKLEQNKDTSIREESTIKNKF